MAYDADMKRVFLLSVFYNTVNRSELAKIPPLLNKLSGGDHIAIEFDGKLTKSKIIEHSANTASDESLNFLRATAHLLAFTRGPGACRARQHSVFGRKPPFTAAAPPTGHQAARTHTAERPATGRTTSAASTRDSAPFP